MVEGDVASLRPHVKTHKMAEVARLLLDAGIRKFKCATIAEAEMLARTGAPDVLLAYQPAGPKMGRLLGLVKAYPETRFSCIIDNAATAGDLSGRFCRGGPPAGRFPGPERGHEPYRHRARPRGAGTVLPVRRSAGHLPRRGCTPTTATSATRTLRSAGKSRTRPLSR
jgi:hypothetical protein